MQDEILQDTPENKNEEVEYTFKKGESPVYIQRYRKVASIIEEYALNETLTKVIDFGTAEMKFIKYLKKIPQLTHIAAVDIDESLLRSLANHVAPLAYDHIMENRRLKPLDIHVYAGNVTEMDGRLEDYEVVTCIELIEHLKSDVLTKACRNIFENIQPKLAIFTTPNADFNVLFPDFKGFRHWDHKFEWSRKEFLQWCSSITDTYPNYDVNILGVGNGPDGSEHLGCCSQLAVFVNKQSKKPLSQVEQPYNLIAEFHYPCKSVNNDDNLFYTVMYYIRCLGRNLLGEDDVDSVKVPLEEILIFPSVSKICSSKASLLSLLSKREVEVKEDSGTSFVVYYREEMDTSTSFSESDCDEPLVHSSDNEQFTVEEIWDG